MRAEVHGGDTHAERVATPRWALTHEEQARALRAVAPAGLLLRHLMDVADDRDLQSAGGGKA